VVKYYVSDAFHPPPPLWPPSPHLTLPSIITQKHQQIKKFINLTNNFNLPTNINKSSKVVKKFTNSKTKKKKITEQQHQQIHGLNGNNNNIIEQQHQHQIESKHDYRKTNS